MIFDVRDSGAVGDGIHSDTAAVQRAIDKCAANGGTILLTNGVFKCGTLYLRSNITLHIAQTATLLASGSIADYSTDTHHHRYRNEKDLDRCFIFAQDCENIVLTGAGTIDGNAITFPNSGDIYRPMMLRFLRCNGISVLDIQLNNSASWTTAFLDSENIHIKDVSVFNDKRYNGDGLDFDGCRHVRVENCQITGTDDNLCLQASSKQYPMCDVKIIGCRFTSLCAAVRIGLKSVGDIYDVLVEGCTAENVWREGVKIECTEGGSIHDITVHNFKMTNVSRPIFVLLNNRFEPDGLGSSLSLDSMPSFGTLKNLYFEDICAVDTQEMENIHYRRLECFDSADGLIVPPKDDIMGAPYFAGIRFDAPDEKPIENVMLKDISYKFIGGVVLADIPQNYPHVLDKRLYTEPLSSENYYPDWSRAAFMDIRNVVHITLDNISLILLRPDERPPIITENGG